MPKILLTEQDIEDLDKNGVTKLNLDQGQMVLSEAALEKARQTGLVLTGGAQVAALTALNLDQPSIDVPQKTHQPGNILRFSPAATEAELRQAIIEMGRILYQSGLMISNDGNISVRLADGNILITPSGVCKGRIAPDDLLVVDLEGNLIKPAADPSLKQSSEQPMHLEVYHQRPDIRAVIHTHLIYANALVISKGEIRMDVIPEAAIAFGEIPVTDFALPSSNQNAEVIRGLIGEHDVLLIRNHGSLTVGKQLEEALINLERLEHVAKTLTYAQLLGNMNQLSPEMMADIKRVIKQANGAKLKK